MGQGGIAVGMKIENVKRVKCDISYRPAITTLRLVFHSENFS